MRKGFTIIEVLFVISILAIIASLIFGAVKDADSRSNKPGQTSRIEQQVEYRAEPQVEQPSSNEDDLESLLVQYNAMDKYDPLKKALGERIKELMKENE